MGEDCWLEMIEFGGISETSSTTSSVVVIVGGSLFDWNENCSNNLRTLDLLRSATDIVYQSNRMKRILGSSSSCF